MNLVLFQPNSSEWNNFAIPAVLFQRIGKRGR